MEYQILNTRELKPIMKYLSEQYGCDLSWMKQKYNFLLTTKNNLHIINREFQEINLKELRVDTIGLYFGELKFDEVRLSMEGSQIVGPEAKTNILEIKKNEVDAWMKGNDIEPDQLGNIQGFIILKHYNDFVGCGRAKEGKILNFVPKNRRMKEINLDSSE